MVSGLELAGRLELGIGSVVEEAVGQGTADAFVEDDEQEGDPDPFFGKPVEAAVAVALEESVGLHLAEVVAQLIQSVGLRSEGVSG